jgi:hypothetical protein
VNETREQHDRPEHNYDLLRKIAGSAACVLGLMSALIGILGTDISFEFIGIMLGVVGYALGPRLFGLITIMASTMTMIAVLALNYG